MRIQTVTHIELREHVHSDKTRERLDLAIVIHLDRRTAVGIRTAPDDRGESVVPVVDKVALDHRSLGRRPACDALGIRVGTVQTEAAGTACVGVQPLVRAVPDGAISNIWVPCEDGWVAAKRDRQGTEPERGGLIQAQRREVTHHDRVGRSCLAFLAEPWRNTHSG